VSVLRAEDLLAGAAASHTVGIPADLLRPSLGEASGVAEAIGEVVLRPLVVRDVERIVRATRDQKVLASALMVQQALVAPRLTIEQVQSLPAGLLEFLMEKVNTLSGLGLAEEELERAVRAPLARACFVLAREFGWTPMQCAELTVGQVLLYLEMLSNDRAVDGTVGEEETA